MHSRPDPALRAVALPAVARALVAKLQRLRAHPILNPAAFEESWRERAGHVVDPDHRPHLVAAVDWLARAQDAAAQGAGDEKGKGGVARGYSLAWSPMCGSCAWQPPVPGGAGEIIPVLYSASRHLRRSALADRAEYAALWELDLQLPSGAMRASWTERPAPSVANTGQALLDWLAAFRETGAGIFAGAARRAAWFLLATLGEDGVWRQGRIQDANRHAALFDARAAWALAEAGRRLRAPECRAAAARALRAVARQQHENGWLPECSGSGRQGALAGTVADTIRGLLEGGRVLEDEDLIARAARAAERAALAMDPAGRFPGSLASDWRPAASWGCLSGTAQMATIWLRLFETTREIRWLEPVDTALRFLKSTQNRVSTDPGVHGGIKAAYPLGAEHGAYQLLVSGTAGFADALLRDERRRAGIAPMVATEAA